MPIDILLQLSQKWEEGISMRRVIILHGNFMWFLKYENNPTATFMVEM
jgi:hypothetical protein